MANDTLEDADIRRLIFKAKSQGSIFHVANSVFTLAMQEGLISSIAGASECPTPFADRITAVVWSLIMEGIYTPGEGMHRPNLPQLRLTEYGRKCFDAGELTAHDPDDYLQRLKAACPSIDEITLLYTGEALDTFRVGKYLASSVMVGVAAENMLFRLVGAVHAALNTSQRQTTFEKAPKGKKAKTQHDEVLARLRSPFTPLPKETETVLTQHIDGIYDFIRRTRNDAGHPTGRRMERYETHALLLLFPTYCKTVHDLMDWLRMNQI